METCILSTAAMYSTRAFSLAVLLNDRVVIPFVEEYFEEWAALWESKGDVGKKEIYRQFAPLTPGRFDQLNFKIDTLKESYFALPSEFRVVNSLPSVCACLSRTISLATTEEAAIALTPEEYSLIHSSLMSEQSVLSLESAVETIDVFVPELPKLSMKELLSLKNSRFYEAFREYTNQVNSVSVDEIAMLREALLELARQVIPDVKGAVVRSFFGNIPSPLLVNPVSVISSAEATYKELSLKKQHGWLFFLAEMSKERASHSS